MMRIGLGYDIHRLQPLATGNGEIWLGNVAVPAPYRLVAHSDGDVVLHALCDALLGAVAAGDIGEWFPDTDAQHAGQNSAELLQIVLESTELSPWHIANVDVNIIAQTPRLGEYKPLIRQRLQELLALPAERVSVKARSNELCDAVGAKRAIQAQVAVLLEPSKHLRALKKELVQRSLVARLQR